jgi:hypothetical protein
MMVRATRAKTTSKLREIDGMSRLMVVLFAGLEASLLTIGTAAAQGLTLPAGPDRELVSRECQACHDLSMVLAATGLTREGWNATIEEMASYGMRVAPGDRAKMLDYLSNYLGSQASPTPPQPSELALSRRAASLDQRSQ